MYDDDLFDEAAEAVIRVGKASASLIQRRLRVGYARAARLLDLLEEEGVIGPADGARPRDVLVTSLSELQDDPERAARKADRKRREELEQAKQAEADQAEFEQVQSEYKQYIDRFCELAERELVVLDEWGDEDTAKVAALKRECIQRIVMRHYKRQLDPTTLQWQVDRMFDDRDALQGGQGWVKLLYEYLAEALEKYHGSRHPQRPTSPAPSNGVRGRQFERAIADVLFQAGYTVSGTPITGDQGADIVASKGGTKFIIQAKNYATTVGNSAVQEAVAARAYYAGDVAVVVSSVGFTASARELARANDVVLIPGNQVNSLPQLLDMSLSVPDED